MDHRSWGTTNDCMGCRFWSEMIAKAEGGGPVQALCLNLESPRHSQYTTGRSTCAAWKSGHLGAIDEPGEAPDYESEAAL